MTKLLPLAAACALLLAGCAGSDGLVAKGTMRDASTLAAGKSLGKTRRSDAAGPSERWGTTFGDLQLDALVEEALAGSPALEAADARTRKAIAQAGLADAARKPSLGACWMVVLSPLVSSVCVGISLSGRKGLTCGPTGWMMSLIPGWMMTASAPSVGTSCAKPFAPISP